MKLPLALVLGLVVALTSSAQGDKIRYDNYKLQRFTPTDEGELKLLNQLYQNNFGVIFWTEPGRVGRPVDIMFPPHLQGDTYDFLRKRITSSKMISDNVQTLIDVEAKGILQKGLRLDWDTYGTLEDIYTFLDEQAAAKPDIASVRTIGKSFEDRDLKVIQIQKPSEPIKPAIWLDGGIHAREWISPAVVTYVIDQLLNSADADIVKITEDFDLFIIPVLNPDGYVYTHTTNRMWRKTRATTGSPFGCRGADPNRNWDYEFNTGGSSDDPCSDGYHGGTAHSQKEVAAAAAFFNGIAVQAKMFLSVHSYSQLILLPFGFSNVRYPDYEPWMTIGNAVAEAIKKPYNTTFTVGNIVDLLYPASGGSVDWVKGVHNTSVVLAFELRDTGDHGFELPPDQIKPSGEEFMEGLKEIVNQLRSRLGMS